MTILELLNTSTEHLRSKGFTNPKTSCEILLAYALNLKRLDLYLQFDKPVSDAERGRFRALYRRRMNREPLQYITGGTEFMSLPFTVNKSVLIPRPETEFVTEEAIKAVKKSWGGEPAGILDVGAGCGSIAVSMAHYLPNAAVTALELSQEAIPVLRENVGRNKLSDRVNVRQGDIFECGPDTFGDLHCVISNPPYVQEDERDILEPDVIEHEPHIALFAGADGLRFYRFIAERAARWLRPGGLLVFEIGYAIGPQVTDIAGECGFTDIQLKKDYAGHDRLVIAENPGRD